MALKQLIEKYGGEWGRQNDPKIGHKISARNVRRKARKTSKKNRTK